MKKLKTFPHFSNDELKQILKKQKSTRGYQDWQIIYSVQVNYGKKAEEFSDILGVTKSKIYKVIQLYNKFGFTWRTHNDWGGRREQRCILTIEEEASLLKDLEEDALNGSILIFRHIKDAIELKAGKEVSDDYVWDLFKRHGWKKKVPRQSHPKGDKEKQEEYKKNSKRVWHPSH